MGPPESLLMLGLAGGTSLRILRHLLPDCRFFAVDIDRVVVEAAGAHMALDDLGVSVEIADAYAWARDHAGRYDVVIDDCYLAGADDVYRSQKSPTSGIGLLKDLITPGGLFLTNLVTGSGHRRVQSRTRAAFKRNFAELRSVTTPESQNETLVGGDAVLSGRTLRPWMQCFSAKKDRDYWGRIETRRLALGGGGESVI